MTVSRRTLLASSPAVAVGCDSVVLDEQPDAFIEPITSNEDFYVYSCCGGADPDPATWALEIRDRDALAGTIDANWLASHPAEAFEHTLQCIGSGPRNLAISNAIFGGMRLADVLAELGVTVDPSIVQLYLVGVDDYDAGVPSSDIDKTWLVWEMNGVPLPVEHGFPARLIILGRFGVKNVKWIKAISLLSEPVVDYWTEKGWSEDAPYVPSAFILSPSFGATAAVGTPLTLVGMAYAGEDPVTSVEITFDGFRTTVPCVLDYAPGANRWVLWSYVWTPSGTGAQDIQVRATTESGAVTSEDPSGTGMLDGYDGGMLVELIVE